MTTTLVCAINSGNRACQVALRRTPCVGGQLRIGNEGPYGFCNREDHSLVLDRSFLGAYPVGTTVYIDE